MNLKKGLYIFFLAVIVLAAFVWVGMEKTKEGFANYLATTGNIPFSSTTTLETLAAYTPPTNFSQKYGTYDVRTFGAKGDGVTNDTKSINQALLDAHHAGGGTVLVPYSQSGNYLISAPLVIYSNTSLIVNPRVTISLAPSSNSNMLIDASHYTGDLTVPSVMHDISVQGGTWARGSNFGTGNNVHSIILGGNNLLVQNMTFTSSGGKYAILIQNATHFTVENLYMNHTWSDGVHVQGPARFGLIQNIRGDAGDDMVSLTPYDWTGYTWGNEGDITDVNIDNIELDQQASSNGVKVLGGKIGTKVLQSDRIHINNVMGSTTGPFMSAIYIGDDPAEPNTENGLVDNVTVNNLNVDLPNGTGSSLITIVGSKTSLEIPNITISNVKFSSDMSAIVSNTGKVANLAISNVQGNTKTKATDGILQNNGITWAYITHLRMININLAYAVPGGNFIYSPESTQGLGDVWLNNVSLYNVADIANISTASNFYLSNVHLLANKWLLLLNGGAKTTIQSASDISASSTSSVVLSGSALSSKSKSFPTHITHFDLSVDIGKVSQIVIRGIHLLRLRI